MKSWLVTLVTVVVGVCIPGRALAQGTGLSSLVFDLVTDVKLSNPTHAAHFSTSDGQFGIAEALNRTIAVQTANVPLASSSGGFTFAIDSTTGLPTPRTSGFGPAFAERPSTIGRGQWSIGANFQRSTYDQFEGQDLDGGVNIFLTHIDALEPANVPGQPPQPFFEGDIVQNTLFLKVSSTSFLFFANYGVTDRFDIGFAVPIVSVDMDLKVESEIVRLSSASTPTIHSFDEQGGSFETREQTGSATGIGDIIVRGKYLVHQTPQVGLSLGFDVKLPTGDDENLLGTGAMQTKVYAAIGGGSERKVVPHANVGFTISAGGETLDPSNEFNYVAGAEIAASPTLTIAGDILGRSFLDFGRLRPSVTEFPFVTATGQTGVAQGDEFALEEGSLSLALAAVGFKWNPRANFLLSAHVLFPLSTAGLRDKFTPVIGFDYSF
jgi:hypothetical protein